jgi:hypothetical protein
MCGMDNSRNLVFSKNKCVSPDNLLPTAAAAAANKGSGQQLAG